MEFDEREVAILGLAARQADDVARLEALIRKRGDLVPGSAGQPVLNPALAEARQGRLTVLRLLGQLSLPDETEEPRTAAARRAQKAAGTRWAEHNRRRQLRQAANDA